MAGIWYRAGSIAVTNGSKKVVGTGTTWKTSVLKPDKGHAVHSPDGRQYELDYVESDTVLYLVTAYLGPTATGQAYAIDVTRTSTIPALSREISAFSAHAQGQYDSWQKVLTGTGMVTLTAPDGQQVQVPALSAFQPTSASLKALQALTPAKDKLPVFNGAAGADLITLTAFMRTLLDDPDALGGRSTLQAPWNNSGNTANMDLDSLTQSGFHRLGPTPVGGPAGVSYAYGQLIVSHPSADTIAQILITYLDCRIFIRSGSPSVIGGAGSYTKWTEIYTQARVVGSVSQSGGIPTGAVIERGSNANGEYIKFADGTLICICQISVDFSALASTFWGTDYNIFPHVFISQPAMSFSRVQQTHNSVNIRWASQVTLSAETGRWIAYCVDSTGMSSSGGVCKYIAHAIGRWY